MRLNRYVVWALIGLLTMMISVAAVYFLSMPRLVAFSPADAAHDIAPGEPLRLDFSRRMDAQSVASRLKTIPGISLSMSAEENSILLTPEKAWPGGQTISVTLEAGAVAAGWPGLAFNAETAWSFQVRPMMLAYLWQLNGSADLYALSPETGEIVRLTQSAGVRDYQIAPDGQWVYFTADMSGGSQILRIPWRLDLENPAQPEVVTTCEKAVCRTVQVSPDGKHLAYERAPFSNNTDSEQVNVWVLDLDAGQSELVAPQGQLTRSPRWAPAGAGKDGWLAVYNLSVQAYQIYPPDGGSPVELPNQVGDPGSWQPDGNAFVASEYFEEIQTLLDTTFSGHLLRYSLEEGGAMFDLSQANNLEDTLPVFSPDGALLAFARKYLSPPRWTVGRQLWLLDLNTRSGRALTNDPLYTYYDFAWRPDGGQIAAVRFNQVVLTEPAELWLFNLDGSDPVQLVIGGSMPQWAP